MDGMERDDRVRSLRVLLIEPLTPLLRREIHIAIKLPSKPPSKEIDVVLDQITEHWTEIYGTPNARACLVEQLALFQQFLTNDLLKDYAAQPYQPTQWVSLQAELVQQHSIKAGSDESYDDTEYQARIVVPLEELILNQEHVERRVRYAESGGYIQHLINQRDWINLATALKDDRDLAKSLSGGHSFYPHALDVITRRIVLRGIDKVESTHLQKPSMCPFRNFRQLLARHNLNFLSGIRR
ncbi:hypothetical protein NUW58_g549 [Xylaria curta]|uniref:Uncharacterized protein n=1 Tax=Xylaria curta TaxID=42375 RepID=A0ACC1PS75_9PEZI|nr:hypothetical protein NUW58_g549 [Xylaria curta]